MFLYFIKLKWVTIQGFPKFSFLFKEISLLSNLGFFFVAFPSKNRGFKDAKTSTGRKECNQPQILSGNNKVNQSRIKKSGSEIEIEKK